MKYLRAAKVTLNEYEFPTKKVANVQAQLEKLVAKNYYLHRSAKDGYRSYLLSYASHSLKHIFNVSNLDLAGAARAFGFTVPPKVNLAFMSTSGAKARTSAKHKQDRMFSGQKGMFSAANPYGKRDSGDARQFSR